MSRYIRQYISAPSSPPGSPSSGLTLEPAVDSWVDTFDDVQIERSIGMSSSAFDLLLSYTPDYVVDMNIVDVNIVTIR